MRFGLVHRIMTDALAALGVLAVVNTASMSPWTTGLVLLGLALSLAVPEAWQNRPTLSAGFARFSMRRASWRSLTSAQHLWPLKRICCVSTRAVTSPGSKR